jgi:hypothetical protein
MIDSLFTGNTLGHKTDIADGSLRGWDFRTFDNLQGDYYIAPRYLEKVAVSHRAGAWRALGRRRGRAAGQRAAAAAGQAAAAAGRPTGAASSAGRPGAT